MSEVVDALDMALPLAAELERRNVDYAIGGALALGIWSDPRGTRDVDINVFVHADRLDDVFAAIAAVGATCDEVTARQQAESRGMFVAGLPNGMRLDVFTPSIDFSWEAARTRVRQETRGQSLYFLSAEAIAVFKLMFFRGRDKADLERLVQVWPGLEIAYVRHHLAEMFGEDDERMAFWDSMVAQHRPPGS